jgi:murein DD-endopeptidase MepM/ murein hydrolase activator NlpD
VKPGETVTAGQPIARCGVSGRTPDNDTTHLHIHMQTAADAFDPSAAPLPLKFTNANVRTPGGCVGVSALLRGDATC